VFQVARQAQPLGQADGPIEGHPGQHLGGDELAWFVPHLPDPLLRLLPAPAGLLGQRRQELPEDLVDLAPVTVVEPGSVEQVSVGVELELVGGRVAHPHRA
jgi:hypothetical protein